MKKYVYLLATALLAGSTFVSCGDDEEEEPQNNNQQQQQQQNGNQQNNNQQNNNQQNNNQQNNNEQNNDKQNNNEQNNDKPAVEFKVAAPTVKDISKEGCKASSSIDDYNNVSKQMERTKLGEAGFCVAAKGTTPTIDEKKYKAEFSMAAGTFSKTIDGLTAGDWSICAYVMYDSKPCYSEAVDFTIQGDPEPEPEPEPEPVVVEVITPTIAEVFTDGCKVTTGISNYQDVKASGLGDEGFCIAPKGQTPTINDKVYDSQQFSMANGTFQCVIHDNSLKNGDWTLRVFVKCKEEVFYSEPVDFSVLAFRSTISLAAISTVYSDGCSATATISDFANVSTKQISESGFVVASHGNPTVNDIKVSASISSDGKISKLIHNDNISDGNWTVKAYVIFDGEVFYSDAQSFSIVPVSYGFNSDLSFYYGDHTYEITEDFDPNNYDPVKVYDGNYYNYVKFSNIPSDYKEFETVYKQFLGKHINGIIALQIMAFEVYNRDREAGMKCCMLINQPSDKNTIKERLSHRYDQVTASENQPYLAATFLQGAERTNYFTPTEPYTIKFQADPDGMKQTTLTGYGKVYYVDVIAEGWQTQKVKRCQVIMWEDNEDDGYYEMHEWSSFVLTAPAIKGGNSKWPGLK